MWAEDQKNALKSPHWLKLKACNFHQTARVPDPKGTYVHSQVFSILSALPKKMSSRGRREAVSPYA